MLSEAAKLYLPALGIVSALGNSRQQVLDNLLLSQAPGLQKSYLLLGGDISVAGVTAELPGLEQQALAFRSRNNQLLLCAYQQIATEVEQLISRYGHQRIAVVIGTSTSGVAETEQAMAGRDADGLFAEDYHYYQQQMGSPAEFLASYLQLGNAAISVSTACSSSAKAFISAANLIRSDFCDAAIVGGVDSLCGLTINGFNALESVSHSHCNPFSRNRDGITIGEGAALFIVDQQASAIALAGMGESSDAHHMSAPDPEGQGAELAIGQALAEAGIDASAINYINLHGTATPKNDAMESAVVNRLFGESLPCSSTKALTGHTLGAAGAIELALCWLLLSPANSAARLAPHRWDGEWDERLAQIRLVSEGDCFPDQPVLHTLSNSFAFGGSNASLLLRAERGLQ